jgi:hypothetical protein
MLSSENYFSNALYTDVVTNKNPKPVGTVSLKCYYEGFSKYTWTLTKNFNYDYTKELDNLNDTIYKIAYFNDRTGYANPFEDYSIFFKELECYGPSGKPTADSGIPDSDCLMINQGGTIIKTITKNSQNLIINSVTDSDGYINKITDKYNLYS